MESFGLVVHEDQIFLNRVVNRGLEQGIFTRDRADEIVRISVAMANKYVVQREVDFRSTEELSKVQETILRLVGVGLEIKSRGDADEGVRLLMRESPVTLFRLAFTRISKLRDRWSLLLQDHLVPIMVSPDEFECLSDLTCQRLSQLSVFSESEIDAIGGTNLDDRLFSTLAVLEYYESEVERYEFILRLKRILPFDLLNISPSVRAENLAEVDSLREALINTLIVSGLLDSEDPVTVSMADIRRFLTDLEVMDTAEVFPEQIEDVVLDLIHELGEGLDESEAQLLTRELIHLAQVFLETLMNDWETVTSPDTTVFFKRWCRLAVVADLPDPLEALLGGAEALDEYDFEMLMEQIARRTDAEVAALSARIPWDKLTPDQTIRCFQDFSAYQGVFAEHADLSAFSGADLVDLLELLESDDLAKLMPEVEKAAPSAAFSLEDLGLIAAMPHPQIPRILKLAGPPAEYTPEQIIREFHDSSTATRKIFLYTAWGSEWFPELVREGWAYSPDAMKQFIKGLSIGEIGPFLADASAGKAAKVVRPRGAGDSRVEFKSKLLNEMYEALPKTKKRAAVAYFSEAS